MSAQDKSPEVITGVPDFPLSPPPLSPENGIIFNEEVGSRIAVLREYERLFGLAPGVQEVDTRAEAIPATSLLVFEKDKEGNIVRPLNLQFEELGLPEPPEDMVPLMLSVAKLEDGMVPDSVILTLLTKNQDIEVRYLEDPVFRDQAAGLNLQWVRPGSVRHSGANYVGNMIVNNDAVLTLALKWQAHYTGQPAPNTARILRAKPTKRATMLVNVDDVDKKFNRFSRARASLAGLVLTSGVIYGLSPRLDAQYEAHPPKPGDFKELIYDTDALNRFEQNAQHFQEGDEAALDTVIKDSMFNTSQSEIPFEAVKALYAAQSNDEVEKTVNEGLTDLDIKFTILRQGVKGEFTGVSEKDFRIVLATAKGIIDGIKFLGPIISDGQKFDIELVDKITEESANTYETIGLYFRDGGKPVIRMSLDNQKQARKTFTHEVGHHENLTDDGVAQGYVILDADDWFEYGPMGSSNGKVGRDINTEYAGTNPDEDAAEMFTSLFSKDLLIDFNNDTLLQEKMQYVMASLESRYPGASAYILRYAKPGQPPADSYQEMVDDTNKMVDLARSILMISILLLMAAQAGTMQQKANKRAQIAARTRF